jgi:glycosyltransferase involved in cell wall biosynthesis
MVWPFQYFALKRADLLHATSEAEYKEIRAAGLSNPVAIIPNGVDLPDFSSSTDLGTKECQKTVLFLGRLHPVKGLDDLLSAWKILEPLNHNWNLSIVGSGEVGYVNFLRKQVSELGLRRVQFKGSLYGRQKSEEYFRANLFVLPTLSENFGMVVAEALAHACPVVATYGAPWRDLEIEGCGWWIEQGIDPLMRTLQIAMSEPVDRLLARGRKGLQLVERKYNWLQVAASMELCYRYLKYGGEAPAFIRFD